MHLMLIHRVTVEEEGTLADILPIAQAAYTTGGKVIVTVEKSHYVEYGSLDTRFVQVPGIYIEAIVLVDSDCAKQTNGSYHNEAFSGEKRSDVCYGTNEDECS